MLTLNKQEILTDTLRYIQHLLLNRPSPNIPDSSPNIPNLSTNTIPPLNIPDSSLNNSDSSLLSPLYDTALSELSCRLHPFSNGRRRHCADSRQDPTPMMRSFIIYKVAAGWFANVSPDEAPPLERAADSLLDSIVAYLRHSPHSTLKRPLSPF